MRPLADTSINVNVHFPGVTKQLSDILQAILTLTGKVNTMSQELDALVAEVEEVKGTQASAIALIQGLHDQLVAAGTDPAKLAELRDSLKSSTDALAAAVAANPAP